MIDPSALSDDLGLGPHIERFDHVAMAVGDASTALPFISAMGGRYVGGGHQTTGRFRWAQFAIPGGLKMEVIAPLDPGDPGNFVNRFLAGRGPGLHHLTFKVTSLEAALTELERRRYIVVGVSRENPAWHEAFIHPQSTNGVLVQIAEFSDDGDWEPLPLDGVLADPVPR